MSVMGLVTEKSGPSKGELSLSRVLPLLIGSLLPLAWLAWFISQLKLIEALPVVPWSDVQPGFIWLGGTFLSSVLPLMMNYWQKGKNAWD